MWLHTEDDELVNLAVFVALRLEPVEEDGDLYRLVGALGEGDEGDEDTVHLSPPLPEDAARGLFEAAGQGLRSIRVKDFIPGASAPAKRQQQPAQRGDRPRPAAANRGNDQNRQHRK